MNFLPLRFPLATLCAVPVIALCLSGRATADVFDNHTAYWLRQATADAEPVESLAMRDALSLDAIGRGIGSPCIVVYTNDDNLAKALLTWGFRKDQEGKRVPVVLIERRPGRSGTGTR